MDNEELLKRIRTQKKKISRLERENRYLNHRLSSLDLKKSDEKTLSRQKRTRNLMNSRSYIGYLLLMIKSTTAYGIYDRAFFAVRKYMLASKIFGVFVTVISFLQTSAVLLIIFGALSALLPAVMIMGILFFLVSMLSYGRIDKIMENITGTSYVFSCARQYALFFTAREMLCGTAFFLTPSFSKCGFAGAKRISDGAFLVHFSYWFRLEKILERSGGRIYFIS